MYALISEADPVMKQSTGLCQNESIELHLKSRT